MKRINFEDGQLVSAGYVKEDGTIEEAVYEGNTPLSAFIMNKLQDNIEEAIEDSTKTINAPTNKLLQNNEAGLDMHNSDIVGANGIFMNDESTGHEGINFLKQRRK